MEKVRVMMADDNGNLRKMVREYFSEKQEVEWVGDAADGREAINMVRLLEPDALILDVVMPRMDGFSVLTAMAKMELKTRVIMLTSLHTEDAIEHAISLGASFYMLKPFEMETLYQRVMEHAAKRTEVVEYPQGEAQPLSVEEKVANLFLALGIPPQIKGYQYLREAVKMVLNDHSVINRITKELYPGVAKQYDTSASKVERAMRHAIEVAWNRGRIGSANKLLGYEVFSQRDKPTNGEFIAMVADKIPMI